MGIFGTFIAAMWLASQVERVSTLEKHVQWDSCLTNEQRRNLDQWVLTALTYMKPNAWRDLIREAGYTGDCYLALTERGRTICTQRRPGRSMFRRFGGFIANCCASG